MSYNTQHARILATTSQDVGKLSRSIEKACDEIERLRDELTKAANYAESSAHIARRAREDSNQESSQS